jgi:hypothetical protein
MLDADPFAKKNGTCEFNVKEMLLAVPAAI